MKFVESELRMSHVYQPLLISFLVESGGAASPREFAAALAAEMAKALIRIPKGPVDAGTAAKVESLRMRYEFTGELWRSGGTEWTVLYDCGPRWLTMTAGNGITILLEEKNSTT